jgi:NAD-dependent dihydropyrimidine dehydrogenase PreA subunit
MAFFIGPRCIDVVDRSCTEVCPVDCIYEGARKLYIHPDECIDCGACVVACPVEAIAEDQFAAGPDAVFMADNAAFFSEPLPGRAAPLGAPGGAAAVGAVDVDTPLVTAYRVGAAGH